VNTNDRAIEARTRSEVIDALLSKLHAYYIFPDVAEEMEQAIMARVLTWTEDRGALTVEEARTSLVFCLERITIDGPAAQATITWSREVATLLAQHEVTVPCPAGRGASDLPKRQD
jgi:MoxR-like ATPase